MLPSNTGRGEGRGDGRGGRGNSSYRGRGNSSSSSNNSSSSAGRGGCGVMNRGGGGGRYNDNYNGDRGGRSYTNTNTNADTTAISGGSSSSNNSHNNYSSDRDKSGGISQQQQHHQHQHQHQHQHTDNHYPNQLSSYQRMQQIHPTAQSSTAWNKPTTTSTASTSNGRNSVVSSYSQLALADPSQLLASSTKSTSFSGREPPTAMSASLMTATSSATATTTAAAFSNTDKDVNHTTTGTMTTDNDDYMNGTYASMNINYEKKHQKASYRSAERSFLTSSQQERLDRREGRAPNFSTVSGSGRGKGPSVERDDIRGGGGGGGGGGAFPFHRTIGSDTSGAASGRGFHGGSGGPGRIGNLGRGGDRAVITKLDVPLQSVRGRQDTPFRSTGISRPKDGNMFEDSTKRSRPDDNKNFVETTPATIITGIVSKVPDPIPPKRLRAVDSGSEGEILSDGEMTSSPPPMKTTAVNAQESSVNVVHQYDRAVEKRPTVFDTMDSYISRPTLNESNDLLKKKIEPTTMNTNIYQDYDTYSVGSSHRTKPTPTTSMNHSTKFKYSRSDDMVNSVSSTERYPQSKVLLTTERRSSNFRPDEYNIERGREQQPIRDYEKLKQRHIDDACSNRQYNSMNGNDINSQARDEYRSRPVSDNYPHRKDISFEQEKQHQPSGPKEHHTIRDSLEHVRNTGSPLPPGNQSYRQQLSHERVESSKSLSTTYDDRTMTSSTAFESAAVFPSQQELIEQQYNHYRNIDRVSLSTTSAPMNRDFGERPSTTVGGFASNGGRGRGRGDFPLSSDRRSSLGSGMNADTDYSSRRRPAETENFSSSNSDRGSFVRRREDDDALMDRYSEGGHSIRSNGFGRGRGNTDVDTGSIASAGRGERGGRSELSFDRGQSRDYSWSGGETGGRGIDRQTPPPNSLRITDPHPLKQRGGPSPVNEYENRYTDSRSSYNYLVHPSNPSTKSPREVYSNSSYHRNWDRSSSPIKRDYVNAAVNKDVSTQNQQQQHRSTTTPTPEEHRRIGDSDMMVTDETEVMKSVKLEDNDKSRHPSPPPLVVPPEPTEPSALVLALLRLADLEAQMEYEYVKYQQLAFQQQVIRAEYKVLEAMPIGMASYQSDYEQYLASLEQEQQQGK